MHEAPMGSDPPPPGEVKLAVTGPTAAQLELIQTLREERGYESSDLMPESKRAASVAIGHLMKQKPFRPTVRYVEGHRVERVARDLIQGRYVG